MSWRSYSILPLTLHVLLCSIPSPCDSHQIWTPLFGSPKILPDLEHLSPFFQDPECLSKILPEA